MNLRYRSNRQFGAGAARGGPGTGHPRRAASTGPRIVATIKIRAVRTSDDRWRRGRPTADFQRSRWSRTGLLSQSLGTVLIARAPIGSRGLRPPLGPGKTSGGGRIGLFRSGCHVRRAFPHVRRAFPQGRGAAGSGGLSALLRSSSAQRSPWQYHPQLMRLGRKAMETRVAKSTVRGHGQPLGFR